MAAIEIDWSKITLSAEQICDIKHINNTNPIIYIGMGSCGLAAGAEGTYNAFLSEFQKLNIDVEFVRVGCIGACFIEPIVDIKMPGKARVSFQKITADKVPDLVQQVIVNQTINPESVIGQYYTERR